MAWFIVWVFLLACRTFHGLPEGFTQAYAVGVLGAVAGMAVSGFLGDWFLPFVYNVGVSGTSASLPPFFFIGGLLALSAMNKKNGARGESGLVEVPDPDGSVHHHR